MLMYSSVGHIVHFPLLIYSPATSAEFFQDHHPILFECQHWMYYLVIIRPILSNTFVVHRQKKQYSPSLNTLKQQFCSLRWWQLIGLAILLHCVTSSQQGVLQQTSMKVSRNGNQSVRNTSLIMRNVPFSAKYVGISTIHT